jgi:hypothetical protein
VYELFGIRCKIDKAGSNFNYIHEALPYKEWGNSPIWKGQLFRIHSPSEHMIGGTRYDMEVAIQTTRVVPIGTMIY